MATHTDVLWTLEFSQYGEDCALYPWHITTLTDALRKNQQDCLYNHRGPNKWQLVHIGSFVDCVQVMEKLAAEKARHQNKAHE